MKKNITNKLSIDGFTLIELLITILVLGIIMASLAGLYSVMQNASTKSQHYDLAVRAARSEIEELRNNGYDSLTPGSTINFTSTLPSGLPANKSGTVAVSRPMPGLRRVDVSVTYSDFGLQQTVTLSSDIGIIGLTQNQ